MGMSFISILFMILSLGGGGDLLDLLPTDAYWKSKGGTPTVELLRAAIVDNIAAVDVSADIAKLGSDDFATRKAARDSLATRGAAIADQLKKATESKDPEVAATCRELLTRATKVSQDKNVRRLMAIRTLGEMKDKDSIPSLKKLTDSKDPFVAEYAQRALDSIAGTPHPRTPVKIADDLNLVPPTAGTVGQARSSTETPTIDKLLDSVPMLIQPQPGQKPEDARRDTADRITQQLLTLLDTTGNLRLDGATFAVAQDVGSNSGWVALVLRREYDRDAIAAAVKSTGGPQMMSEEVDGVPTVTDGRSMNMLFPSNNLAVLITGPSPDTTADAKKSILAAIKSGKGDITQNADLAPLLKQVDQTKDIWAVMRVPALMKQEIPFLTPIDTLTLTATHKGPAISYEIKGTTADADKAKDAVTAVQSATDSTIKSITEQMAHFQNMNGPMPSFVSTMQAGKAMLESIKVSANGASATMTGEVNLIQVMGSFMGVQRAVPAQTDIAPMPR